MNNVNDLNQKKKLEDLMNSAPTQTISLSALKEDNSNGVNINTTNGVTGVVEETPTNRPTININTRRKVHRRTSDEANGFEVKKVNPDDYIEKPAPVKSETPRDRAMNLLADAVNRKQEEYREFVANAVEADKENRERVEAGLESVNGEVQYMPDALHEPIKDEDRVAGDTAKTTEPADSVEDIIASDKSTGDIKLNDTPEDDFEYEDADDLSGFEIEGSSRVAVSSNPFTEEEPIMQEYTVDEPQALRNNPVEIETEVPIVETEVTVPDPEPVQEVVEEEPSHVDVIEKYDGGIFSKPINVTASALNNPISETTTTDDFDIDEEDLEGVTAPVDDVLSDEEVMKISEASEKHLKSEILQKIIQAGKTMDTTQFVVSNKVINIKDALKTSGAPKVERTAIWPLTYAGRPYKASALKGPEIAMLADADNSEANGGVGLTIDQAQIMFEHDANPYRPSTIEAWAKTIPYSDIENIFAALYIASLKGANYIPMACPKNSCQYAYLSEDVSIDDMVKFENDEAKKRFEEIKKMEITPENTGAYESVVNVINDKFAIGIKVPSIFTILYEYDALNADFIRKYTAMVSIIQYIDYIYYIDADTHQFQPIGWKTYPGDHGKSFKSKIATYSKILKELDDTDFTVMIALINSMINKVVESRGIKFEIPAAKCPKCGATIEAREINARGLVFMRQRLVELATTPSAK